MNFWTKTPCQPMASARRLTLILLTASLAMIAAGFGVVRKASAQGQRSVNDGVYTTEQAQCGEKLYMGIGRCYVCHLRNLQGDSQRRGLPLSGPQFLAMWNGKTVDDLFYKIHMTMPADIRGAGTLPVDEVADLVAFILQQNKFPAGSQALSTDSNRLKQIAIIKRPG